MKVFRVIVLIYFMITFPVVVSLNLPIIGSYSMIKFLFFSFANRDWILLVVFIVVLVLLWILTITRNHNIFDAIVFVLFIVDFIICIYFSFADGVNYIIIQSVIFDLVFSIIIITLRRNRLRRHRGAVLCVQMKK